MGLSAKLMTLLQLPASIVAGVLGRRVVFDLHENVPGQLLTKEWLPALVRPPLSWASRSLLHLAERTCSITLAEPGYAQLFTQRHPVFANYPDDLPAPQPSDGAAVYVGDVTAVRGVPFVAAAMAAAAPEVPLRVVGPCSDQMAAELHQINRRTELVGHHHGVGDEVLLPALQHVPPRLQQRQVAASRQMRSCEYPVPLRLERSHEIRR